MGELRERILGLIPEEEFELVPVTQKIQVPTPKEFQILESMVAQESLKIECHVSMANVMKNNLVRAFASGEIKELSITGNMVFIQCRPVRVITQQTI